MGDPFIGLSYPLLRLVSNTHPIRFLWLVFEQDSRRHIECTLRQLRMALANSGVVKERGQSMRILCEGSCEGVL